MNVMEQTTMTRPEWTKVAEVELVYRTKVKASERPLIKTSKDCYETFLKVWDENKIEGDEPVVDRRHEPHCGKAGGKHQPKQRAHFCCGQQPAAVLCQLLDGARRGDAPLFQFHQPWPAHVDQCAACQREEPPKYRRYDE